MNTKRPIPALTRPNGTEASEHSHIIQELQRAPYGGEHTCPDLRKPHTPTNKINIGEVDQAIKASPNGAVTGLDNIPRRAVRECRKVREKLFLTLMNTAYC